MVLEYSESIIQLSERIDNRPLTPYSDSHESTTVLAGGADRKPQARGRSPRGSAPGQTVAAIQCLWQSGLPLQGRPSAKAWAVLPAQLHPERQELDSVCAERRPAGGAAAVAQLPAAAGIDGPLDHAGDGTVASQTAAVRAIAKRFPKAAAGSTHREASHEGFHFIGLKTLTSAPSKGFRVSRQKLAKLLGP